MRAAIREAIKHATEVTEIRGPVQQFEERHYSVAEVAKLWGVCGNTIRDLFRDEPGVLKFHKPVKRGKRGSVSLRIPRSVLEGVHRRWQK